MLSILEVAKNVDLSKDKARYWLKLLDIEPIKKDRILLFPEDSRSMLEAMKKAVAAGMAPVAAAAEIRATFAAPVLSEQISGNDDTNNRLRDLEKAIMLLVESNKKLLEANKLLHDQNKAILESIAANSKAINKLLPMEPCHKAFKVWQPKQKEAPKVSALKKIWLELFNPSALRATP